MDGLVRRLEQLIVDAQLHQALSAAARKTVLRKFNIIEQGMKVRSIYLTLLTECIHGTSRRRGPDILEA